MYDCIVVGAGIAGAVAARQMAEAGKTVLVIEQRNHIGGNCYDCEDVSGILIHQYGPHIFHTNSKEVFEYLSRFTEWLDYHHEVLAYVNGNYIPVPFNLNTLQMVFPKEQAERLREKMITQYGYGNKVTVLELKNHADADIREIADYVYKNIFLQYTMKQWGQTPEEVDASVIARVPVMITEENGYFQDTYQGMPKDGYTKMFENMLAHSNIEVHLSTAAADVLRFEAGTVYYENEEFFGNVFYTGAIDELFDCKYGRLPYRTLDFQFKQLEMEEFQPASVVNYTVSEAYTRITEFKKLTGQKAACTSIVKEYPGAYTGTAGQIPYYAIINEENQILYKKYLALAEAYPHLHMLGRLAEYKYYNIDAITLRALEVSKSLLS